ncbi:28S ribosomal protein S14-like protein [Leptotrombidium deliense]|uniref:28S ribosomal protein S14-like protein n=1 Tax=Leptotrombidium deliense TaxID=299467 RepID=A0A443SQH6_9ACAR|nr:28S ribosomal protein S14-like protein [Leptotrombidium deliense]
MDAMLNSSFRNIRRILLPLTNRVLSNACTQVSGCRGIQKLVVAGTSSPYETKLKRKRVVNDPNFPGFEINKKGLEWTNWLMLRDLRRRYQASEWNAQRVCLQAICRNRFVPNTLREEALRDIVEMPRNSNIQRITNRCSITSRARGRVRPWRISRLVFRHLADYNYLSGVMKSTWGP